MTDESMAKEDRKRRILQFLVDTGLSLPPKAIHHNMELVTWSIDTTRRLLGELADDGYVSKDPDMHGYYAATAAGERYLRTDTSK